MTAPAPRFAHDMPFGATILADGNTRFRLRASDAIVAWIDFDDVCGDEAIRMNPEPDGQYAAVAPVGAGTCYRYRLTNRNGVVLSVPDPAAHAQWQDIAGPNPVVDPQRYQWQYVDWQGWPWHGTVLYKLYVGALGGFKGVRGRLPELARLGITAIELMPVAEFPGARNQGYDGVLPFTPDASYGTPDDLKALIDTAHGLGIMVFLDMVYSHFGPDGNYLYHYTRSFLRDDVHTPWGAVIDFRKPQVREFFIQNALTRLMEYRFDSLRLDAVHAITERDWLSELATRVRLSAEPGRHMRLMLENEHNTASLLRDGDTHGGFSAQWNDDGHNVFHALLTGERETYYATYAEAPAQRLARVLQDGFCHQGEPSPIHENAPRGGPSAHLPPTAFVLFLQSHDQTGNRAFGERLTQLAHPDALYATQVLLLLSPQIPMLSMGEEWGSTCPFQHFTSHHGMLAEVVREGRRREFAKFETSADPHQHERIPNPDDELMLLTSSPGEANLADPAQLNTLNRMHRLLALHHAEITPRLPRACTLDAVALGHAGALVRWRMGDGSMLTLMVNLSDQAVAVPTVLAGSPADPLHESREDAAAAFIAHRLLERMYVALLHTPSPA